MDSKGDELNYLAEEMKRMGADVIVVDVGAKAEVGSIGKSQMRNSTLLQASSANVPFAALSSMPRGEAIRTMSLALTEFLIREHALGNVGGVVGVGGSGGTALIAPAMQALPVGVPKLMVSTVASGNTSPYVGTKDITMMPSVVDVAGLNAVSKRILSNAASAISSMARDYSPPETGSEYGRRTVALTMFGVTTACVDGVRSQLESAGFDALVFHATGTGGAAMEELVASRMVHGVLDLTTTEVADYVVGGVMACGDARFEATVNAGVPLVISTGALDMVNFGGLETVPLEFQHRNLFVHNDQVTLMRTTKEENIAAAKFIASKLNQSTAPVCLLLPEKGVSMLDAPDMQFHDPEATEALHATLEKEVIRSSARQVVRVPHHINDPEFADAAAAQFVRMMGESASAAGRIEVDTPQPQRRRHQPHTQQADTMDPEVLVEALGLIPHPEGGFFRETYRSGALPMASMGATDPSGATLATDRDDSRRNIMTSIYWLLNRESPVGWWCSNASDHIHYYHGGGGITYMIIHPDGTFEKQRCGPDVASGDVLQFEVKGGSLKCCTIGDSDFTLIGEAVAPGFDFRDFSWVTEDSLEKALENCAPELFEDLRKYVKPDQRRDFKTWYSTDQTE
mmetsp:Transcript_17472/g.33419  ORF Transcript_17472/g.33419 Transcript_17472/m.33419 type:complete len:627 (+) Transcript_17472:131-2011(+)